MTPNSLSTFTGIRNVRAQAVCSRMAAVRCRARVTPPRTSRAGVHTLAWSARRCLQCTRYRM